MMERVGLWKEWDYGYGWGRVVLIWCSMDE
jgi:hypothetical protein